MFKNYHGNNTPPMAFSFLLSLEGLTPTLTQTTLLTTSQTSSESSQTYHQIIENVVNPLGTVTTVNLLAEAEDPLADNPYVKFSPEDYVIHENCDESLFRPVVVFCDNKKDDHNLDQNGEFTKPPVLIENKLVVPVIDKSLHMVLTKKEAKRVEDKFEELSSINKMSKADRKVPSHVLKEEDVKGKEEVIVSKGKKSKKKAAELFKEPTPPRDIKKRTKKDDVSKIAESDDAPVIKTEIKEDIKKCAEKSEKVTEDSKATKEEIKPSEIEVKPIKSLKIDVKPLKQEHVESKEGIAKINENPESKKAYKEIKKNNDSIKKERKSSLEKAVLKMGADIQAKEVVQKTAARKKSLELEHKIPEDKKSKDLIPIPVEQKFAPDTALNPIENEVDKPDVEEVVLTLKKKGKNKSEALPKKEESDSTYSEEKSLISVKNVNEEEKLMSEEKIKIKTKEKSPLLSGNTVERNDEEESSVPDEIASKEQTTKNKDITDKKVLKDESEIKKKVSTTDKKNSSTPVDEPEKTKQVEGKDTGDKKEKPLPLKENSGKTEPNKSSNKKADSRSSSPAKEVKQDEISSPKVVSTLATKNKFKSKKQSRESSPDIEEVKLTPTDVKPEELLNKEPELGIIEKPKEALIEIPEKDPVEPTMTTKKKKKNKKPSRESSPEILSRKNSLKDERAADLPVIDDKLSKKAVDIEVEQTVTIKKKNKNKKPSRESSPESQKEISLVDDNLSFKTKSNAQDKSNDIDEEYKVIVKEILPKEFSPIREASSTKEASPAKEVAPIKEASPPKKEPKITDFLKFVDHFNKKSDSDDFIYKVAVKDISPPETDNDFPSLSFSTKKTKKNKKPTPEMVLPIEKEPVPIVETISPFQPLDRITPTEEGATLINFESPESTTKVNIFDFERPKGFPKDVIFAICGNLSDENPIESEKEFLTSSSTASASDETTDEATTTPDEKNKIKKLVSPCNLNVNDDEELRPLISTTADNIEATPTPEVLYPCKYSQKDAKSSDSSSDTGGGSYAIPEATVVSAQPEQQSTNQQHLNPKKKIKRRKR